MIKRIALGLIPLAIVAMSASAFACPGKAKTANKDKAKAEVAKVDVVDVDKAQHAHKDGECNCDQAHKAAEGHEAICPDAKKESAALVN